MPNECTTSPPHTASSPTNPVEWQAIHDGKELGPITLAELVKKVVVGEIDAGDLVRETNGLWTKARDCDFLQQQFLLRNAGEEITQRIIGKPARFHSVGKWVSIKDLLFCSFIVLVIVGFGWWSFTPTKDAPYYLNCGLAWSQTKDYDKAIEEYDEAIRLSPNYYYAFYNRGLAWSEKKEYEKAIHDFDDAIRLNPEYAKAFHNRGLAWVHKKNYDKAIEDYDEAIRFDPNDADAFDNRGNAFVADKLLVVESFKVLRE